MKTIKILIALFAIVIQACELYAPIDKEVVFDNPLDPNGSVYYPPQATILEGPTENEEVIESLVTYIWAGNHGKSTFRYKLLDYSDAWSDWLDTTQVSFTGLVDAGYTFLIQEKYPNNVEQLDTTQAHFVVNAINGPALLFNRSHMEVSSDVTFTVKVLADEFNDVMILFTTLQFDPDYLRLQSVTKAAGAFAQVADAISFLSTNPTDANANGDVAVNIGRFGGTPAGFTGNSTLFELTFSAKKVGNTSIVFKNLDQQTIVKNSSNQNVVIRNYMPISITIN